MKQNLSEVICCPICKSDLLQKEQKLLCKKCNISYPIKNDIPILDQPPTPIKIFCEKCKEEVEAFEEPWSSFRKLKGEIIKCSQCKSVIRKCLYNESTTNQKKSVVKKFVEQDFDSSASVYEFFQFPFASALLGVNPLKSKYKLINIPTHMIKVKEGGTVLDVATGTGLAARELGRIVGSQGHVYGLDISLGMLKKGKEKAERRGIANITFVKGDMERLPFQDNFFDDVTCLNAYVSEQVVAEISRVLRKGCMLVMTAVRKMREPNLLMKSTLKISQRKRYGSSSFFAESEIMELLTKYGFNDIHIQKIGLVLLIKATKQIEDLDNIRNDK